MLDAWTLKVFRRHHSWMIHAAVTFRHCGCQAPSVVSHVCSFDSNTCSAATLMSRRHSNIVGFVSDVDCLQVRLAVVTLFVMFTAGVQEVSTRRLYFNIIGPIIPTHDADSRVVMLRSQHPNFVTTREMHMLNMCPRIFCLVTFHKHPLGCFLISVENKPN